MAQLCFNGVFLPENEPVLHSSNRGFRYGDGLFETMRVHDGTIPLSDLHFERLFSGIRQLEIKSDDLNASYLLPLIIELCQRNDCSDAARVRLAVFRNERNGAEFLIEAGKMSGAYQLNDRGLKVDIYDGCCKQQDAFAVLKTANYLPYVMAGLFAHDRGLDEALVLNQSENICDGSKTNIFLIKERSIYTPALNQGCVAGVMRRFIIQTLRQHGIEVAETVIRRDDLLHANEVFITNAIRGIQWVGQFEERTFTKTYIQEIYQTVYSTLPV